MFESHSCRLTTYTNSRLWISERAVALVAFSRCARRSKARIQILSFCARASQSPPRARLCRLWKSRIRLWARCAQGTNERVKVWLVAANVFEKSTGKTFGSAQAFVTRDLMV